MNIKANFQGQIVTILQFMWLFGDVYAIYEEDGFISYAKAKDFRIIKGNNSEIF